MSRTVEFKASGILIRALPVKWDVTLKRETRKPIRPDWTFYREPIKTNERWQNRKRERERERGKYTEKTCFILEITYLSRGEIFSIYKMVNIPVVEMSREKNPAKRISRIPPTSKQRWKQITLSQFSQLTREKHEDRDAIKKRMK